MAVIQSTLESRLLNGTCVARLTASERSQNATYTRAFRPDEIQPNAPPRTRPLPAR
jgi:hypothetical protein